jgi:hypothetical protein
MLLNIWKHWIVTACISIIDKIDIFNAMSVSIALLRLDGLEGP